MSYDFDIDKIRTGDRLLVNGTGFIPRTIRYFMRKYAKRIGYTYTHKYGDWIASHAGTFIVINNYVYVAESVKNGYRLTDFRHNYDPHNDDMMIVRTKRPYTRNETSSVQWFILYLQEINEFYQYWGLLTWAGYIWTGINLFGRGGMTSTYCYEATFRILNEIREDDWQGNKEIVSFFDLIREDDVIIYDGRKK